MIINTGNRTDIPAFYSEWFINRIKEGYVYVRNPYYPKMITKYSLKVEDVDIIVFCSKNPLPLLKHIDLLLPYRMFWHITITPYNKEIEPNVPNKNRIIDAVKLLSSKIGSDKVVWRYDPIIINDKYTTEYHIKIFEEMCKRLSGYVDTCIFSFLDLYKKTIKNFPEGKEVSYNDREIIAKEFTKIATKYHIKLKTCLENETFLNKYDIDTTGCMKKEDLEKAFHITLKNQYQNAREGCQCLLNNDIGAYNTCLHACKYCYANYDMKDVYNNYKHHDKNSPLLIGQVTKDDIIRNAKIKKDINPQISLFEL